MLPKDVGQGGLYRETHTPQASGTYGVEGDDSAASYLTPSWAQVALYPPDDAPLEASDTLFQLTVIPVARDLTIDIFVNDQLVETKTFPPASPANWTPFRVQARWQAGVNTVRLVGHGTPTVLPNDPRPALFRMLDPRRIVAADGSVLTQGVITADTP